MTSRGRTAKARNAPAPSPFTSSQDPNIRYTLTGICSTAQDIEDGEVTAADRSADDWHELCPIATLRNSYYQTMDKGDPVFMPEVLTICNHEWHESHPRCWICKAADTDLDPERRNCVNGAACADRARASLGRGGVRMREPAVGRMSLDQIQAILDNVSFRPLGQARWNMTASEGDAPILVEIELEHWVNNSRTFDHWDEFFEQEIHPQTFTTETTRPYADADPLEFVEYVLRLAVEAIAHEAMEWFVYQDGIFRDPHVEGDPHVSFD